MPRKNQSADTAEDMAALHHELRAFREEKEKVRQIIGQIGGKESSRNDRLLNVFFILLLGVLLAMDIVGHYIPALKLLPFQVSLEIGVLLVSMKIIWMIHKQSRIEHFQFWILNSIEFRLTEVSRRLNELQKDTSGQKPEDG